MRGMVNGEETQRTDSASPLVIAHTSDVHVDHHYTPRLFAGDGCGPLRLVIEHAAKANANVLLLAGDTFDCHRLPVILVEEAARVIAQAPMPVVILPGNHDPAVEDAIYHLPAMRKLSNLAVLGMTHEQAVRFPEHDLEIWGKAHRDYGDMDPLAQAHPRSTRWQIAMAHGHYTPLPDRSTRLRPSWLIGDDELEATACDYIALGHWNRFVQVGAASVPAYYSGSPDYARSINIISLSNNYGVNVKRSCLELPDGFGDTPGQPL